MIDSSIIAEEIKLLDSRWHKILFYLSQRKKEDKLLAGELNIPFVNVNLVLSEKLIDIAKSKYPLYVDDILNDHISSLESEIVWLGNIEILFDPQLHINPVRLFENMSKRYKIVVSWTGNIVENKLTYAVPGHPEYYVCHDFEGKVLTN